VELLDIGQVRAEELITHTDTVMLDFMEITEGLDAMEATLEFTEGLDAMVEATPFWEVLVELEADF
jgi:hypothetical protein